MPLGQRQPFISRREFLKRAGGLAAAAIASQVNSDTLPLEAQSKNVPNKPLDPESNPSNSKTINADENLPVNHNSRNIENFPDSISGLKPYKFNFEKYKNQIDRFNDIRLTLARPFEDTPPEILSFASNNFIEDFMTCPEILEASKNPNIHERFLQIIRFLSVQSKEEVTYDMKKAELFLTPEMIKKEKLNHLLYYFKNFYYLKGENSDADSKILNDWNTCFPGRAFPSLEVIEEKQLNLSNQISGTWNEINKLNYSQTETWSGQLSCNLYASSFIACLGLQQYFSHRVDSQGNPIIYKKNENTNQIEMKIMRDGVLANPIGEIVELSAEGQHNWLIQNGAKYGWEDLSNASIEQVTSHLEKGEVIFGSTESHNWCLIGIKIGDKIYPALTQATDNQILRIFPSIEDLNSFDYSDMADQVEGFNTIFGSFYKLIGSRGTDVEGVALHAHKV